MVVETSASGQRRPLKKVGGRHYFLRWLLSSHLWRLLTAAAAVSSIEKLIVVTKYNSC